MSHVPTIASSVAQKFGPRWKTLMIEGVCAIILGVIALVWPRLTFLAFIYVFGFYALVEGLALVVSAFYQRSVPMAWENPATAAQPGSWLLLLIQGMLTILAGLLCLFLPHYSMQSFVYVIALWALFIGLSSLLHIRARGWHAAAIGALALIVSLLLFFNGGARVETILWLIGICAILAGELLLWRGWLEKDALSTPAEPVEPAP